jgi:predicted NBD/HSP70 family sugar kinase
MSREVRRWRLHLLTGHTLADLARKINPIVRGWMRYYGSYYRTALDPLLARINAYLMRWIRRKLPTATAPQESRSMLASHHPSAATAIRPLGMEGHTWLIKTTRAG